MTANLRQRQTPAPLPVRVTQAELLVLQRRQLVGARASSLGQNLRRQLASPAMLLWAGGLGFVAADVVKRRASTPTNTEPRRASHNKVFARALKLIAFAHTLSRAFPSVAVDPYLDSELSNQTRAPQFRSPAAS